jgi:hypothetical protein
MKTHRVMEFVKSRFPGSQLKDQHDGLLYYRILPGDVATNNVTASETERVSVLSTASANIPLSKVLRAHIWLMVVIY